MTLESPNRDSPGSSLVTDQSRSYRAVHDFGADISPSMAVIQAAEEVTGIDAVELPPLYGAIDPDALDALVQSADRTARVEFDYGDLAVTVQGDGEISVTVPDET